jgi:hypothetical protein
VYLHTIDMAHYSMRYTTAPHLYSNFREVLMFEKEFQYFLDHQDELVRDYDGKILVLRGEQVVGVYESKLDAYSASIKKYERGTFMIQQCIAGPKAYRRYISSFWRL